MHPQTNTGWYVIILIIVSCFVISCLHHGKELEIWISILNGYPQERRHHNWGVMHSSPFLNFSVFTALTPHLPRHWPPPSLHIRGATHGYPPLGATKQFVSERQLIIQVGLILLATKLTCTIGGTKQVVILFPPSSSLWTWIIGYISICPLVLSPEIPEKRHIYSRSQTLQFIFRHLICCYRRNRVNTS